MKRRNFLQTAAALSVPTMMPFGTVRASTSPFTSLISPDSDRVLVIVHLFGGNDGLNTVIPLDQLEGLGNARGYFNVREKYTLKINDTVGFHPVMDGMKNMFSENRLQVIQSVGYPNHNRSHFRSTDIWTSGSASDDLVTSGWMGRYLETVNPGYPAGYPNSEDPDPPAISIGNIAHPTCEGDVMNFSQTVSDPANATQLESDLSGLTSNDKYGEELSYIRTTVRQTNKYNAVIKKAYDRGSNEVSNYYDPNKGGTNLLAKQLQLVARLISGGLKTKVYTVYLGGFDLHANQVGANFQNGTHAELLRHVDVALTSFQKDLTKLDIDDRVMGMTFSEFGRRIKSNASLGTDHGTAGPMFLFGSCVNAGVVGDNVKLGGEISQSDGVPMQFDFRDVYGSILVDWFKVKDYSVRSLLHQKFKYMPLASDCNEDSYVGPEEVEEVLGWDIGTPYAESNEVRINIQSPDNERLRYSMFDMSGRLVLANEIGVSGKADYTLFTRPTRLPLGTYKLRLATNNGSVTTREVVFK